jgi:hypothetical protein
VRNSENGKNVNVRKMFLQDRTGQDRTGTWYIVVRSSKKMEKEKVAID